MPAMQEPGVPSLGGEDPLEKEMATPSSILAMDRGAWGATVHRVAKSPTRLKRLRTAQHIAIGIEGQLH